MPKWGLTSVQRNIAPWGIAPEWLQPGKTLTDPVHSDIYLTKLEVAIVDSPPMQRLRQVRQLGTAHLVYPGATHSRFSHALGTLRAAQDLMDAVVDGLSGPRSGDVKSLLQEWQSQPKDLGAIDELMARGETTLDLLGDLPSVYDRRLAEATVLARLGGLLHDLCHVPMGHTVEDDLQILEPHDGNVERFERLWGELPETVIEAMGDDLARELRPLILSKEIDENGNRLADPEKSRYPFVTDIVGNTICADLMDYLRRDHMACGLPLAVGSRFVDSFYVTSSEERLRPQRMAIRVTRAGHLRHDILTELGKYLSYRYQLSERVLYHHAKVAADAMVGKLLDMWHDSLWVARALDEAANNHFDVHANDITTLRRHLEDDTANLGSHFTDQIDRWVRDHMEDEFLGWGDDGLLSSIESSAAERAAQAWIGSGRDEAIATLARMIIDRELFKDAGRADSSADLADAAAVHAKYRGADARRTLEEAAARFAGIDRGWNVVIWVPSPSMRPKVAQVLVNRNGRVAPLAEVDGINNGVKATVDLHRKLWGVGIYVHPAITSPTQRLAVAVWVKDQMGLNFLTENGGHFPSVAELVTNVLGEAFNIHGADRDSLLEMAATTSAKGGGPRTLLAYLDETDALRRDAGIGVDRSFEPGWLIDNRGWLTPDA